MMLQECYWVACKNNAASVQNRIGMTNGGIASKCVQQQQQRKHVLVLQVGQPVCGIHMCSSA